jgi:hypothetical protein
MKQRKWHLPPSALGLGYQTALFLDTLLLSQADVQGLADQGLSANEKAAPLIPSGCITPEPAG